MSIDSEQLHLPLGIYPTQEVEWEVAEEVRDWRKFGRYVVMVSANLALKRIDVESINELKDSRLRYALRFAAAASAMDVIRDNEFNSHGQEVRVMATDEGDQSRLLAEWYSGTGMNGFDSFMADIHSFAPEEASR